MTKRKLLRITTVAVSLKLLLKGQFRYLSEHSFEVLTVSDGGPEVAFVEMEGARHIAIPFTRRVTPLHDLWCLWKLVRVMRSYEPDIVHSHTPKAGLLAMLAAKICRVPVRLHTVAGLPYQEAKGLRALLLMCSEWITYLAATRLYPNSFALRDYLHKKMGFSLEKLTVIGKGSSNGIDLVYFQRTGHVQSQAAAIRNQHSSRGDVVFSFVGRVVKDKGLTELIRAFKTLSKEFPCRLWIIGELEMTLDPLDAEDLDFLRQNPGVTLTGFQEDVRPWMVASDIFVFPSYREGFPNVVLQACALEVPVIVSDINGCNEIITDRVSGLIVPPKNSQRLTEAMRELAHDPGKRAALASCSSAHVAAQYEQSRFWSLLLREYQSV